MDSIATNPDWIAITISIASLIFSLYSVKVTSKQFTLVNQGYLDVEPFLGVTVPGNDSIVSAVSLQEVSSVEGLNFYIWLENVGNLLIAYDVREFSVKLDEREMTLLEDDAVTTSTLYPKQRKLFQTQTVRLNDGLGLTPAQLKSLNVESQFSISYKDLNQLNQKFTARKLRWNIHDNIIGFIELDNMDSV